jgi:O-Antigen ligase
MRWLFILLIGALAASDILAKDMSLGPGLSVKNAILYVIALTLFFRLALSGQFKIRLPVIHAAFAVWVTYAVLTWIACWLLLHYPGYEAKQALINLKGELIDPALFFLTVFYGLQDEADYKSVLKMLAFAMGLASIVTLTDVMGLTNLGVRVGTAGAEDDRVFGVFGHANETGALVVCMLPALVAVAFSSRGPTRLLWLGAAAASLAVLILTVSRGAFVGFVFGYSWAVFLCRRYLPLSRVGSWVVMGMTSAVVVVVLVSLAAPHIGAVLTQRLLGQSTSVDVGELSSGRTGIWINAISYMMAEPVTLLTGFGWNVYDSKFVYATHNYYLDLWFNLGLVGVVAWLVILYQVVVTARRAADVATPEMRRYMIACVFGILSLAISVCFTNLTRPWPYIWIYIGISMWAAVGELSRARESSAPVAPLAHGAPVHLGRGVRVAANAPLAGRVR